MKENENEKKKQTLEVKNLKEEMKFKEDEIEDQIRECELKNQEIKRISAKL